jgi:hypothetical protein
VCVREVSPCPSEQNGDAEEEETGEGGEPAPHDGCHRLDEDKVIEVYKGHVPTKEGMGIRVLLFSP